jgi:WD40 repeat protein/Tfp pilus assembly protein PilF
MGVVYEAEQVSLGRRVALKVLPRQAGKDRQALERFRREARSAARLHHTNIVPVFEVGQDGDVCYYAMQFIPGQSVDQVIDELRRLRADSMPPQERRPSERLSPDAGVAVAVRELAQSLLTGRFHLQELAGATSPTSPPAEPAPCSDPTVDHVPAGSSSATVRAGLGTSSVVLPEQTDLSRVRSDYPHYFRSVARVGQQVAGALAYAHARGIVHRDVKPSNLLLDAAGVVWVTDFGLVKTEEDALTRTGDIVGTVRYMAPERLRGECDARADVYGLGLSLYELLTLRTAFDARDRVQLLEQVKSQDPPRPRSVDQRIPRDLETIVLKAIDKDPRRRYQTADDLAEDLRRFVSDEPIRARRVSVLERLARWARRHKGVAASLIVIAFLLVAVAVGAALAAARFQGIAREKGELAEEREAERVKALQAGNDAEAARQLAEQRAEEIRSNLYCAEMNLAAQAAASPAGLGRVNELLAHWRPTGTEPDRRGWEWYYLAGLGQRAIRTLPHAEAVFAVSWSPDGKRLASAGEEPSVRLWDTATWRETAVLRGHASDVSAVSWSPDGRRLASAGVDRTLKLWDVATGQETATLSGHALGVHAVSWSPDGRRLASASSDQTIKLWDADTGREVASFRGHGEAVLAVSWSPDGRRLASASSDQTIKLWDVATGQETATLSGHALGVHAVSWSPDSRHLASGGADNTVKVWDADTGREAATLRGHTNYVHAVSWSPDGRRLGSAALDQAIKLWDVAAGREILTLRGHLGGARAVSWSPDGRQLASSSDDQTVKLWDADPAPDTLRGHTADVWEVSWGPDGRRLASAALDNTVKLWDAITGRETATLRGHTNRVRVVSWSPDGRRLASAGYDGTFRLWDAATGRETATVGGHGGSMTAVDWSPDGRRLATGTAAGLAALWDPDSGRATATLRGHAGAVWAVSWGPDSRRLASASGDRTVRIWDADAGREIATLRGHMGSVQRVSWSPDGRRLASAGVDQTIKIWDVDAGREIRTLSGHAGWVHAVAWSPDGRRLASAGWDQTVKLWDPDSGREVASFRGHGDRVQSVSWSPDGRRLASAGSDQTIKLWDATPGYIAERSAPDPATWYARRVMAQARQSLGQALLDAGRADEANAAFDEALAIRLKLVEENPHSEQLRADLAASQIAAGDRLANADKLADAARSWEAGVATLEAALKASPDSVRLQTALAERLLHVGGQYAKLGLWELAADHYRRAFKVQAPPEGLPWARLADLLVAAGDLAGHQQLRRQVQQKLEVPEAADPSLALTHVLSLAPGAGLDPVRLAKLAQTELDPQAREAWRLWEVALAHYRAGQFDQAVELLTKPPLARVPRAWPVLAMVHHRSGRPDEARRWLTRAEASFGERLQSTLVRPELTLPDGELWWEPILLYLSLREARGLLDGREPSDDHRLRLQRGRVHWKLGNKERAEAEFAAAVELRPDDAGVWLTRARVFAHLGLKDRMAADLARARQSKSKEPRPWAETGRFLAEGGEHAPADTAFVRAAAIGKGLLYPFLEAGWWVAGPYPEPLDLACPPEFEADPSKPVAAVGQTGEFRWQPVSTVGSQSMIDLWSAIGKARKVSYYVLTYAYADRDRIATLLLRVRYGDDARLWVNRRLAFDGFKAWKLGSEGDTWIPVSLRAGRNTILVKISHVDGYPWCHCQFHDHPLQQAIYRLTFGSWAEAADAFAEADRRVPLEPWRYERWLRCLVAAGRWEEYRRTFAEFVRRHDPPSGDVFLIELSSGCHLPPKQTPERDRLAKLAVKWVEQQPNLHSRHFWLANAYLRAGRFEEAEKSVRKAIQSNCSITPGIVSKRA